ncbi:MAG TPA: hypothetical protein VKR22_03975, partial [Acidimicrobiales bacterium]|nr:hypothetical protein [Acidimicrobiales bacterium]
GCRFHTRCPKAQERCFREDPELAPATGDRATREVACFFPLRDGETLPARTPVNVTTPTEA